MAEQRRKWEVEFLEVLEVTGTITAAAKAVGIGRQTVYDFMNSSKRFADRCRNALEGADDALEAEARRLATEGEQVPVFYRGELVGHKPKKNPALLAYLLKSEGKRRERLYHRARSRQQKTMY